MSSPSGSPALGLDLSFQPPPFPHSPHLFRPSCHPPPLFSTFLPVTLHTASFPPHLTSLCSELTPDIDEIYNLPHIVRPGETIASTGFDRKTGGKGSNQAYAVARAGGKVVLDAQIGSDGLGVRDRIASGGVDVSRVRIVEDEVGR